MQMTMFGIFVSYAPSMAGYKFIIPHGIVEFVVKQMTPLTTPLHHVPSSLTHHPSHYYNYNTTRTFGENYGSNASTTTSLTQSTNHHSNTSILAFQATHHMRNFRLLPYSRLVHDKPHYQQCLLKRGQIPHTDINSHSHYVKQSYHPPLPYCPLCHD